MKKERIIGLLCAAAMLPPVPRAAAYDEAYDILAQDLAANGITVEASDTKCSEFTENIDGTDYTLELAWSNIRNSSIAEENSQYTTDAWLDEDGDVTAPEWFEGTITLTADASALADGYSADIPNVKITVLPKDNMSIPSDMQNYILINSSTDSKQYSAVRCNFYDDYATISKNGAMGFILPCESKTDQYVTVKLNGADTNSGLLFLADAVSGKVTAGANGVPYVSGIADRRDRPELNFIEGTAQYEKGYIYSTYLIPSDFVYEDEENGYYAALRLYSTGARNNYASVHISEQNGESRGIYGVYISDDSAFNPTAFGENIETREVSKPGSAETSTLTALKERAKSVLSEISGRVVHDQTAIPKLNGMFTRTNSDSWDSLLSASDADTAVDTYYKQMLDQNLTPLNGTEIMAKLADNAEMLGLSEDEAENLRNTVTQSIDFLCRSQGSNGGWYSQNGWIGAGAQSEKEYTSDGRLPADGNNLTGFGLKSAAQAVLEMFDDMSEDEWNEAIDTDCDGAADTARYKAWAQMMAAARDFLVDNPSGYGHAPNQDMADITAALRFEKALEKMQSMTGDTIESGYSDSVYTIWDDEKKTECMDTAFGLKKNKACLSYWVSPGGLILENFGSTQGGYSGDYGAAAVAQLGQLCGIAEELGMDVEKYDAVLEQAYESISNYYFLGKDSEGKETLYTEGLTSNRNNYYPGTERYPLDFYSLSKGYDAAVVIFKYDIMHDREQGETGAHFEDNALLLTDLILNWDEVNECINECDYEFPMEDDDTEQYAWADEMGRNVVVKNGTDRLYIAMNWRNPLHSQKIYAVYNDDGSVAAYPAGNINNKARVHYTTEDYDSYGLAGHTTLYSNLDTSSWNAFEEYGYVRGVMFMPYGNYYVIMNSTGLMDDEDVKVNVSDFEIEDGVYADMMTMQDDTPTYYVIGDTEYTPENNVNYVTDREIAGGETVVLCRADSLLQINGGGDENHEPYEVTDPSEITVNSGWVSRTMYDTNKNAQQYMSTNKNNTILYLGTYDLSEIDSIDITAAITQPSSGNDYSGKCGVKIGSMPYDENTAVTDEYLTQNSTAIRSAANLTASVIGETSVSDAVLTSSGQTSRDMLQGAEFIITRDLVCADKQAYTSKYDTDSQAEVYESSRPLGDASGKRELFLYATAQSGRVSVKEIRINFNTKIDLNDERIVTKKMYNSKDEEVTEKYTAAAELLSDGDITAAAGVGRQIFTVYDFGENGAYISKAALYNDGDTAQTDEFIMVYGDCSSGTFDGEWKCGERFNVLRTNGKVQNGFDDIENGWQDGSYAVSGVGRYRYVAVYNWSNPMQASEVMLYSSDTLEPGIGDVVVKKGEIRSVFVRLPKDTDSAKLYIAQYDDSGALAKAGIFDVQNGENTEFSEKIETQSVKLYLWDDAQAAVCGKYIYEG